MRESVALKLIDPEHSEDGFEISRFEVLLDPVVYFLLSVGACQVVGRQLSEYSGVHPMSYNDITVRFSLVTGWS